jgi:hypothetical protein
VGSFREKSHKLGAMPARLSPVLSVLSALYQEDPQHSVPALLALLTLWQQHPRRLTRTELAAATRIGTPALSRALRRLADHAHPRTGRPQPLISGSFPAESGKLQYGLAAAGVALCQELGGVAGEASSQRAAGADGPTVRESTGGSGAAPPLVAP